MTIWNTVTAGETASGNATQLAAYRQGKGRGKTLPDEVVRRSSQRVHGATRYSGRGTTEVYAG